MSCMDDIHHGGDTLEDDDASVSIEISVAENVYVSIKTNVKGYDDVLKDAKEISRELRDHLYSVEKRKEKVSHRAYG